MAGQQRPERELRIGDAERTAAADELAEHYALGRLSAEEHSDRLDAVWAARRPSDLAPVFTDLPGGQFGGAPHRAPTYAGPVGPLAGRAAGPGRRFGMLPTLVRVGLAVLLVVLVVAHLPLIVLGLVVWLVLTHKHRGFHAHRPHGAYRPRC